MDKNNPLYKSKVHCLSQNESHMLWEIATSLGYRYSNRNRYEHHDCYYFDSMCCEGAITHSNDSADWEFFDRHEHREVFLDDLVDDSLKEEMQKRIQIYNVKKELNG